MTTEISEIDPMQRALDLAKEASSKGEAPIGAVVTNSSGVIIAGAHNLVEADPDPSAHAEILAIRRAALVLQSPRLIGCSLYVTLEPCAMCAGAIAHARIKKLVFGAYDEKGGGVEHGARVFDRPTCHHKPEVIGGVRLTEASKLLRQFFEERRG